MIGPLIRSTEVSDLFPAVFDCASPLLEFVEFTYYAFRLGEWSGFTDVQILRLIMACASSYS